MSITTKTGDSGETGLMYGKRVPKNHPRIECIGSLDELNAALGMARAFAQSPELNETVMSIQKDLVGLMGEIAVDDMDQERYANDGYPRIQASDVERLTSLIKEKEKAESIDFKGWATPGATVGAAGFDVARAVCRRAERLVIGLEAAGNKVNPETRRYLNRVSDLCWILARLLETRAAAASQTSAP